MAASAVGGFALAALLFSVPFSGQISAQPPGSASPGSAHGNGVFAALQVGQMVQVWSDTWGPTIRVWEDADGKALMMHKVKEIGSDFIVLEFEDKIETGSVFEYRFPVYCISQVVHVGKSTKSAGPGSVGTPPAEKKPAGPEKKPGMPKKKAF
jgi:hypothetical protein